MYTFGFAWNPWTDERYIADGESICRYVRESARKEGIEGKVRFGRRLVEASWEGSEQVWSLSVDVDSEEKNGKEVWHAKFVIMATGYYDYEEALESPIPGLEKFQGKVIHPQFWDTEYDYTDKKIVVVGSGSTAVTLLPALAEKAKHVTMLQRSRTYVVSQPATDAFGQWMQKLLPERVAYRIIRFKFLLLTFLFINFCNWYPGAVKRAIKKATIQQLPGDVPHDPHFEPRYNPWEQRLCLCPDGDFFKALRAGKTSVVTDAIDTVTEKGIRLASGTSLDADVIVTATGLKLKIAGGAKISVDNVPITINEKFLWKAVMLQDVPNLATVIGYTNASWTLGADATALLVCRLLEVMKKKGATSAVPRVGSGEGMKDVAIMNITSTYVVKGKRELPRTGDRKPWRPRRMYVWDLWDAKFGDLGRGLEFVKGSR